MVVEDTSVRFGGPQIESGVMRARFNIGRTGVGCSGGLWPALDCDSSLSDCSVCELDCNEHDVSAKKNELHCALKGANIPVCCCNDKH